MPFCRTDGSSAWRFPTCSRWPYDFLTRLQGLWNNEGGNTGVCVCVCVCVKPSGLIRHMVYDLKAFASFCSVEHLLNASPNNLWIHTEVFFCQCLLISRYRRHHYQALNLVQTNMSCGFTLWLMQGGVTVCWTHQMFAADVWIIQI